ncbi:site-specific integrase [uncultured Hydrogenophaga sp.]|uniref:site-specific integrase n=1 Tax=uncultured Hydrogenophaga sp. TaxID=199683 RepID=UPI00258F484D|nr:site-specific integrase [uncultured Hydrogenophaga sp.]
MLRPDLDTVATPLRAVTPTKKEEQPKKFPFKVAYTREELLEPHGYAGLADIPFILGGYPAYHRLGSAYLIDKGLGYWSVYSRPSPTSGALPPQKTSLNVYAHWLVSFLAWVDKRGVDLKKCSYAADILGRFQSELVNGTWSRSEDGTETSTANFYTHIATDFVSWMAAKGHREAFEVPMYTRVYRRGSATDSKGHEPKERRSRKGKLHVRKRRLKKPTDESIEKWLASVYKLHGYTSGLICELILLTGLRRREAVCFRVDTLPIKRENWHIINPEAPPAHQEVLVTIRYGAKGKSQRSDDNGDKVGPARDVKIPLHFAERLDVYRSTLRTALVSKWVARVRGVRLQRERLEECVHLFRAEKTGQRFQYWKLYDAWTKSEVPFDTWHPHYGRDYWACSVMLQHIKAHEAFIRAGGAEAGSLLLAAATDIIRLHIQPQLGHANLETCYIYLQWISDALSVSLPERYQAYLDERGEELEA